MISGELQFSKENQIALFDIVVLPWWSKWHLSYSLICPGLILLWMRAKGERLEKGIKAVHILPARTCISLTSSPPYLSSSYPRESDNARDSTLRFLHLTACLQSVPLQLCWRSLHSFSSGLTSHYMEGPWLINLLTKDGHLRRFQSSAFENSACVIEHRRGYITGKVRNWIKGHVRFKFWWVLPH